MLENGSLTTLNMRDILPNRFQPRIHFDEIKLNELAESIRKYGVIQPIVVRQIGNKYEIIAGERRYKASVLANRETIPAIISNLSDRDTEEIALLENIQRQNLTAIEEAVSYKRILSMGYITQEELAKKVGKSQSTIANKVRLLNLDDQVQDALLHGKISERHARSLLRLHNKNDQVEMLFKIINERLTVKRTDAAINELLANNENGSNDSSESDPVLKIKEKPIIKAQNVETLDLNEKSSVSSRRAIPKGSHKISKIVPPRDYVEIVKKNIEGKEKNMDIDKILNEAQDINVAPETKTPEDISSLMKQNPNTVVSEPIHNEEPVQNTEPSVMPPNVTDSNKFVNVNAIAQNENTAANEQMPDLTSATSFDNIFNQQPISTGEQNVSQNEQSTINAAPGQMEPMAGMQNPLPTPNMVNNQENVNNGVQSEMPMMGQMPVMNNVAAVNTPTVENTMPLGNNSLPNINTMENANNIGLSQIPTIPVSQNQENMAMPTQNVQNPAYMVQPNQMLDQNNMMPMAGEQVPMGGINQSVIPTDNGVGMPVQNSTINNVEQPLNMAAPAMGQNVASGVNMINNPNIGIQPGTLPQAPIGTEIPVISPTSEPVVPVTQGMQGLEMPSSEILESSANQMAPIPAMNGQEAQVLPPSNDAHGLMQVINMIRNCAKEVENLGFYVDVDEINLDNSYKVTFTINKE